MTPVRAPKTSLAADENQDKVGPDFLKINIMDTGAGIAPEHQPHIFDPYFSTKQRSTQRGMGLGLAVAKSIIKKHQGFITVESEPGQGTTVSLFFPGAE